MEPNFATLKPVGDQPNFSALKPVVTNTAVQTPSQPFKFDITAPQETEAQKIERYRQNAITTKKAADVASSPLTLLKDTFSPFASSEVGLGNSVSKIATVNSPDTLNNLQNSIDNEATTQIRVLKAIKNSEATGADTTKYKQMYNESVDRQQANTKLLADTTNLPSTGEVLGQIGGTALDLLTAGTYSAEAKAGMSSFELATKSKLLPTLAEKGVDLIKNPSGIFSLKGLKTIATGAGIGYGFDVTQGLQGNRGEDRTGGMSFVPGINTVISAGIPAVVEAGGTIKNLFSAPKYLEDLKTDWNKVGGDFVKSDKILTNASNRGKDPINMLSERGFTPQSMVDSQTGLFSTHEASDRIRTQDTAPFEEVLQKSLQEADRSNPPIQVADAQKIALDNIKRDSTLTLGQKKALTNKINDEFSLLADEYKNGISRVDSNIEKRKFWQNTKFDRANPIERDFFYQMGTAFKQIIENHTPDVNIQGINSYLGDLYESAKFLDSLNGKKPKITSVQKVTRAFTKAASTYVGAHLGGGLPGGAAGYIVGNPVSHALESMPNPLKTYFLNNLKTTNNPAYEQAVKYLGEQEAARLSRIKLPSGDVKGVPKVINVGPKADESGIKILNAKKTPYPTVNPKNGRMQTTYTSEGQLLNGGKNSIKIQPNNINKNSIISPNSNKQGGFGKAGIIAAGATALAGASALGKTSQAVNYTGSSPDKVKINPNVIEGIDITKYATDPQHEAKVQRIYNAIPETNDGASLDTYIEDKFPTSPLTGDMIYKASQQYTVPVRLLTAIMQQDSGLGTTGLGVKTHNPGNIGNTDDGKTVSYPSWQDGVNGVAKFLANYKTK